MDLEEQEVVKRTVAEQGLEGVIVILGSPDPDSAELFAETVSSGDPTWAGPLAGVSLGLPVYHVTEPEIRESTDAAVYQEQIALSEMAMETEEIWGSIRGVRSRNAGS